MPAPKVEIVPHEGSESVEIIVTTDSRTFRLAVDHDGAATLDASRGGLVEGYTRFTSPLSEAEINA